MQIPQFFTLLHVKPERTFLLSLRFLRHIVYIFQRPIRTQGTRNEKNRIAVLQKGRQKETPILIFSLRMNDLLAVHPAVNCGYTGRESELSA